MPVYRVTRKVDGVEVYRYEADAAVEWTGMEFSEFAHDALPAEPPGPPSPPPPVRHITKLAFRNRFTQAEKAAIEIASLDNPSASMQLRGMAAALRSSQADVMAAQYIDLDRPDTRAGVIALEQATILGAGRALQILDAQIEDHEVYRG